MEVKGEEVGICGGEGRAMKKRPGGMKLLEEDVKVAKVKEAAVCALAKATKFTATTQLLMVELLKNQNLVSFMTFQDN